MSVIWPLFLSIVLLSIAVVMVILITIILSRSVSIPANKAVELASRLAAGDFTQRIDLDQKDEMGQLGKSLKRMELQRGVSSLKMLTLALISGFVALYGKA